MSISQRPFLHQAAAKESSFGMWYYVKRVVKIIFRIFFLIICALATAYLIKQSYPKPAHASLAWIALIPFVWALLTLRRMWQAWMYAWLVGTLVYAGIYFWIFVTCLQGGGLSRGLSVAAWLGLSALMALQFALFGFSCYFLKRLGWIFPWVAAISWVALDWIHQMLATYVLGFPWFSLAYSQWNFPQVLQIVSWTGAAGLSAAIAFVSLSIGYGFYVSSLRALFGQVVLAAAVFGSVYGYGTWYLNRPPERTLLHLRTAVMQPNIDQYKKWSPEFEEEIYQTLTDMSAAAAEENVMLIVWPESVTPGPVEEDPYKNWIEQFSQRHGAWQLLGSNRAWQNKDYVSAFLFSPDGQVQGFYDKKQLVPFGEFIPFAGVVQQLFPDVKVLGELGGFVPGQKEQSLLQLGQIPLGNTICYESIFPEIWRKQAKEGARFMTNITNDAWFFDTDAPYQHLAVSVLRAVELRRPVLRAANTGISAIIAPEGDILARAELNTRAMLSEDLSLPMGLDISFYTRWGDWFSWICVVIYVTVLISVIAFFDE